MYVHEKCALSAMVLESERRASGFCAVCGQMGAIYHVNGTVDYYEAEVNGVVLRHGEREESESIPDPVAKILLENQDVDVSGMVEGEEVGPEDEVQSEESIPVLDMREDLPMGVIVEDAEVKEETAEVRAEEAPTDPEPEGEAESGAEHDEDVDSLPAESVNTTETLEEQIAALRAKIDALEAEKE